jgi:murein DD-endopeptidase MepM/ murein hydrolase activator NlpD
MRTKRAGRLIIVGMVVAFMVGLTPTGALAGNPDRYAELQKRIADTRAKIRAVRAKERAIMSQITASDQRRMTLERSLASVTDQLTLATRRLELLQIQVDQAAGELALKNAELEGALADMDLYSQRLRDRAANVYMRGPTAYEAVLFNATDFHAYVAGLTYAESVLNVDVDTVEKMRELKANIEVQRATIAERRLALEQQSSSVAAEQAQLAGLRQKQASARSAVVTEIDYKRSLLRRVRTEKAAYAAALQSYLSESNSIADLLRRAQRGQRVIQGQGGYLKWPVSGRVTSEYGWRTHPVYGYRSFHTGIDVAAPSGTTVKAARAGEVLYVGYKGAFGLIVLIDHGNSVATMYAHLSRSYVSPGDAVSTLGSVGAVGCTGWCTGPHVHFEVRSGGEPQNPRLWL